MQNRLTDLRIRILERVARGEPADVTLCELCTSIEAMVDGAMVGVTLLDRASRTFDAAIFPSIPKSFADNIRGAVVAERPGSCALAVYQGETVTSDDVASDPRFQTGWKQLNLAHGIAAIQSRPLCAPDGPALGTLVIGFRTPRALDAAEEEIVAAGVELAATTLTRHRTELQHELLIGELQHRTRNLFSAIGAVVYSTLKAHPGVKDFRKVFDGRLAALSRAHSLAVQASDMDLRGLITDILAPYSIDHLIEMGGPRLTLASDATVAFSLAIHELATNATKYGALSCAQGRLEIAWDVTRHAAGENVFELTWTESGGPRVAEPEVSGFGRLAIERSLANTVDGAVALDFRPAGLICTIRAPLTARLGNLTN
jgi:two-component sensor histidine kinase